MNGLFISHSDETLTHGICGLLRHELVFRLLSLPLNRYTVAVIKKESGRTNL